MNPPASWPVGGGEAGKLIRARDWSRTRLGPVERWPRSLKAVVDLLLPSGFPMVALWGPELVQIYNDGYRGLMGSKHPAGLGQPTRACWPEVWHINEPIYERVLKAGETLTFEDKLFPITRHGELEDTWFTLSYSPLRDDGGLVAGVLVTVFETTARHLAEAELRASEARLAANLAGMRRLHELHARLANETDFPAALGEILAAACEFAGTDRGTVQLVSDDGERLEIFAHHGYGEGAKFIEHFPQAGSKPACDAARRDRTRLIIEDVATFPALLGTKDREVALADGVRATQSTPMVTRKGELVGVLSTQYRRPHRPSDQELRLIDLLAWTAADFVERHHAEAALRASEELFRSFAETSADVLWIVDAATGRLDYLSPAFEAMWGEPRDVVLADLGRWGELLHPDDQERASEGLPRLLRGDVDSFVVDYRIVRPSDGAVRWIRDTGFSIRDPASRAVRRIGGVAQDVTEDRHAGERVRASEERLRVLMEGIPQLVWRAVDGGDWTWSSPQWRAFTGLSDETSRGRGWLGALHPDDREGAMAAWERAEATGVFEAEYRLCCEPEGHYRWFQARAAPLRDEAGAVLEWLGTSTDVDELRGLHERQRLLLAELQHRVRNTLGVVRSIARRTAATCATVEDYAAHLDGRLNAFARTQAMVTRDPSAGIDLAFLVAEELQAHTVREGEQVRMTAGPSVRFHAKAAEAIGLAVHELATNAVKHGALLDPGGLVEVAWRVEADGSQPILHLSWTESGGPAPAAPPRRRGFGAELLERTLAYELKARTRLEFAPSGLRCAIELPLTSRVAIRIGGEV